MQNSRRHSTSSKNLLEADRHSLEFTSGQLIIAICGLLFLWLVGFLMGVMAGRLEFGGKPTVAEADKPAAAQVVAKADPGAKAAPKAAAPAPAKPATLTKDKPRVAAIPAPPATPKSQQSASPVVAPAKPAEKPAETKKPEGAVSYLTDRPDRPSLAATQTQPAKTEEPKTEEAKPAETAATAAATPEKAPETPKAEAPKAEEAAAKPAEEPAPAKKEEEAPKQEAAPSGKTYAVQVFSVKAQNRSNADEYVTLLRQNSGLDGEVVKSKDGKHYNVVIGRYPDRKSAEKKRDELKKKAGFADCIVREIG